MPRCWKGCPAETTGASCATGLAMHEADRVCVDVAAESIGLMSSVALTMIVSSLFVNVGFCLCWQLRHQAPEVDQDTSLADAVGSSAGEQDPRVVGRSVLMLLCDTLWSRASYWRFGQLFDKAKSRHSSEAAVSTKEVAAHCRSPRLSRTKCAQHHAKCLTSI